MSLSKHRRARSNHRYWLLDLNARAMQFRCGLVPIGGSEEDDEVSSGVSIGERCGSLVVAVALCV